MRQFSSDERAASAVIGALLIFAILILALGGYQLAVVSTQNSAVEWEHHQQAQDEMLDVRNSFLEAKLTGKDRHTSIKLGTEYPPRVFAVNPPNPPGTLQTSQSEPFEIRSGGATGGNKTDEVCGLTDFDGNYHVQSTTRLLSYEAHYNEFDGSGPLTYEHSVLYQSFDDRNLPRTGQRLVQDDQITLIPLTNAMYEQRTSRISVEPKPGFLSVERVVDPYIELPTRLDEETWQDLLIDVDPNEMAVVASTEADVIELSDETLDVLILDLEGTYTIRCGAVGVNAPPESGTRAEFPAPGADVHPAEQAGIRFLGRTDTSVGQNTVEVELENLEDSTVNISRFTVNFHQGSDSNWVRISDDPDFEQYTQVRIGDPATELDPQIELRGGEVTTVHLQFSALSGGDWFMMTVQFGTGERTQWFVGT